MKYYPLDPKRRAARKAARLLRVVWPALGAAAAYKLFRNMHNEPNTEFLVMQKKSRKKSILALAILTSLSLFGRKILYIRALGVDRRAQRNGVGARFVQNIEQSAQEKGSEVIVLTSGPHRPRAQRFYKRQGFQQFFGFIFWKRVASSTENKSSSKQKTEETQKDS